MFAAAEAGFIATVLFLMQAGGHLRYDLEFLLFRYVICWKAFSLDCLLFGELNCFLSLPTIWRIELFVEPAIWRFAAL
jgi:hypothetical protein